MIKFQDMITPVDCIVTEETTLEVSASIFEYLEGTAGDDYATLEYRRADDG